MRASLRHSRGVRPFASILLDQLLPFHLCELGLQLRETSDAFGVAAQLVNVERCPPDLVKAGLIGRDTRQASLSRGLSANHIRAQDIHDLPIVTHLNDIGASVLLSVRVEHARAKLRTESDKVGLKGSFQCLSRGTGGCLVHDDVIRIWARLARPSAPVAPVARLLPLRLMRILRMLRHIMR